MRALDRLGESKSDWLRAVDVATHVRHAITNLPRRCICNFRAAFNLAILNGLTNRIVSVVGAYDGYDQLD